MTTTRSPSQLNLKQLFKELRRKRWLAKGKKEITRQIQASAGELKLVIGAGGTEFEGWVSSDIPHFDATSSRDWDEFFEDNSIQYILAEHVLEHLTEEQNKLVLGNAFRKLKSGGHFRIAVPDAWHANPEYIEATKPGGWDTGSDDHKTFWNVESFAAVAAESGFNSVPREYHDAQKHFHFNDFDLNQGHVYRSRGKGHSGNITPDYSSLIIDFVKE